jgi:hypothetical protein
VDTNPSDPVVIDDGIDQRGMQPQIHSGIGGHFEQDEFHYVRLYRRKRATDPGRVGKMTTLAGAAFFDDPFNELLGQASHDLLATAIVEGVTLGSSKHVPPRWPLFLHEASTCAGSSGGYRRDRPCGAAADKR